MGNSDITSTKILDAGVSSSPSLLASVTLFPDHVSSQLLLWVQKPDSLVLFSKQMKYPSYYAALFIGTTNDPSRKYCCSGL